MKILVKRWKMMTLDEQEHVTEMVEPPVDRIFDSLSEALAFVRKQGWDPSIREIEENLGTGTCLFRKEGTKTESCLIARYVGEK